MLWSMALLDECVTAGNVALLRVSGDGKVNDGLGRGKKERADVASHCRSELPVLSSEAETNAQTVPHTLPSKIQILCALTVALLPAQSPSSLQQLSNRYSFVSLATSSCEFITR